MTPTSTASGSHEPRRLRKLRTNVAPLLNEDESLIGAIALQSGPKTTHLALMSLLLSPIIAMIALIFFRRNAVLIQTSKQTRLYRGTPMRPLQPATFLSSVRSPIAGGLAAGTVRIGQDEWRVGEGWEQTVHQFPTEHRSDETDVVLAPHHDETLSRNRRLGWLITAGSPLLVIALIAGVVWVATRPNAFSVSYQASEQFCSDGNYGEYLAVETLEGPVMVAGFSPRDATRLESVHSRNEDRYEELVRGWRSINDGVDVVCVSHGSSIGRACADSDESVTINASRWDVASNTEVASISLSTDSVPCSPPGYNAPSEYVFDELMCSLLACRAS